MKSLEDSFQNMVSRGLASSMHVGRIIIMDGLNEKEKPKNVQIKIKTRTK